jgi:putative oxidoreductase
MHNTPIGRVAEDLGKFLLRATLAILILFHGIAKIKTGISPILGMIANVGLPPPLGYLVYIGEVLAPALVLVGVWTRPAALVIAINMTIAVLLVHTSQFFTLAKSGGWALELQGMYFFAALTIALLGAGRFSIGGTAGKWN